jgi:GNAT superfamily N-acetyltransferase
MLTTIRNGTMLDLPELDRLLPRTAGNALDWLPDGHGHLLVYDLGNGTLGAAVHVDVRDTTATVDLLVVDPALAGRDIEDRLSSVAHALCEAFGCTHVELACPLRR